MNNVEARHMETWARAAACAARYMRMNEEEREGPEGRAARATLVAELAALLEISQQLDEELPLWQQELYIKAAQGMAQACRVSLEEIAAFGAATSSRFQSPV